MEQLPVIEQAHQISESLDFRGDSLHNFIHTSLIGQLKHSLPVSVGKL